MQDKNTFTLNSNEPFPIFVDSETDNKTGVTGVAVELATNFELRKSGGGSFVGISPTIAEIGDGHYQVTLLASHRDTSGPLVMRTTATGANSVEIHHRIVDPATIIRDAVGLAAADLDDQLGTLSTFDPTTDQVIVATNNDKTGYALTTAERTAIAVAVAADILNDGDGSAVMQAIADQIAADWVAGDVSPVAVASAVRTALATELARIDAAISSRSSHGAPTIPTASEIRTELETDGGKLDHLHEMTEDDGGTRRLTANALEQAPSGGGGGGSGDATEAKQDQILAKFAGTVLKVNNNVSSGGEIAIYLGDDDTGSDALVIPHDGGAALETKLTAATSVIFGAGRASAANQIVGTVTAWTDSTVTVEITSAQKAGAKAGDDYTYHIKSITSGRESVELSGCLELRNERAQP